MKLLVTGGAGFIGSNFILYWMDAHPDDEIVNFDALTYAGNLENLASVEGRPNYTFIKGDITDSDQVSHAMRTVDTVVHFAAESHVDRSITDAAPFLQTNVLGTQALLENALKNKITRFHHVSTDEVYGTLELDDLNKFSERTPYNPKNPYSASKAAADHLVRAYYHTHGVPITITNCSNNFGPYQFPEKLIPLAITNLMEGKKVPIYGDGRQIRDWLYVIDHCRAIDLVLHSATVGQTYCVGGMTQDITNKEVVLKIIKLLGADESMIEHITDRSGHDRRYAIDWSKIKSELSWQPKHRFDQYLERTVSWYQENKDWWQRVKSGAYQKYYQQQYAAR